MLLQFQEIPWHLMSQNHQLIYAHVLVRLQNAVIIRMGPLARINFALFSDVKTIFITLKCSSNDIDFVLIISFLVDQIDVLSFDDANTICRVTQKSCSFFFWKNGPLGIFSIK